MFIDFIFLLLFKYGCLHFPTITFTCPVHPYLPSENYKMESICCKHLIFNKLFNGLRHIPKLVNNTPRPRTKIM